MTPRKRKVRPSKKATLLSAKIWHYLNGRYESFEKEHKKIAKMISNAYEQSTNQEEVKGEGR